MLLLGAWSLRDFDNMDNMTLFDLTWNFAFHSQAPTYTFFHKFLNPDPFSLF